MGPVLCEVFAEQGATVVPSAEPLLEPREAEAVVRSAGEIDILVANLAYTAPSTPATEVDEAEWRSVFAALVDPLPRLVRAAAPGMISRRAGKFLVIGSASALRGMPRASTYSAARGAQLAQQGFITGASNRNRAGCSSEVALPSGFAKEDQALLTDPQTSGGLLVSCDAASVGEVMDVFRRHGVEAVVEVGEIVADGGARLVVR